MFDLYIGNKNYSSWSLRPWLLLKHFGFEFREHMFSVGGLTVNPAIAEFSDNGRVPALHDGALRLCESLAIAEYLAEIQPGMWPSDRTTRARARAVAAEMHCGFAKMRAELPMNLKYRVRGKDLPPAVAAEVARIVDVWQACRRQNPEGPYLFGRLTIADAAYAPVVWRFWTYNIALPEEARAYRDAMLAHPAMQEWYRAGVVETEVQPHYDAQTLSYGELL